MVGNPNIVAWGGGGGGARGGAGGAGRGTGAAAGAPKKGSATALCGEAVPSVSGVRGTGQVFGDSGSMPDGPEPCEVGRQASPIWCITRSTYTPCNGTPTAALDPAESRGGEPLAGPEPEGSCRSKGTMGGNPWVGHGPCHPARRPNWRAHRKAPWRPQLQIPITPCGLP